MELHQVRYFLAACETLNFTRAAEQCHVSQPALTQAVKRLEEELGEPLFHREGKRVLLSEFGGLMRPHLAELLGQTETVQHVAENFRLLNQVPIRFGVMPTVGPVRFSGFLSRFRKDQPGIDIEAHEGGPEDLARRLEAGEIDLAVMRCPEDFDQAFRIEPLYGERYVVVFPPGHRFTAMNAIRLKDLSGEPYVDRLACEMREMVMATCETRGVELYAAFRSEREDWVQGMVLAGLGFAFMPEFSVTLTGMGSRPLVEPEVTRSVALVTMAGRRHSPAVAAFVRALRAHRWPG